MKYFCLILLFSSLSYLFPQAYAEDNGFFIVPKLFLSSRNFEYSVAGGGVSGNIQSLGLGITATIGRVYASIDGERTISPTEEDTTNLLNTRKVEFERSDTSISLGYALDDAISIFTGYKFGKSTLIATAPSPFAGAKISLEGQGMFIGAGGRWPVKNWGFMAFSGAYAKMNATYKDLVVESDDGSASGTSLSLKWQGILPIKQLSYNISLTRHDYYYERLKELNFDISEQILSFRLGVSYQF